MITALLLRKNWRIALLVVVVLFFGAAYARQSVQLNAAAKALLTERADMAGDRANWAAAAASAGEAFRNREKVMRSAQERIQREGLANVDRLRADASTAAADHSLRDAAAVAAATCDGGGAGSSAVAGSGPPASAAGVVLADVLARVEGAAVELGAALDLSNAAGITCQRAYDSLIETQAIDAALSMGRP